MRGSTTHQYRKVPPLKIGARGQVAYNYNFFLYSVVTQILCLMEGNQTTIKSDKKKVYSNIANHPPAMLEDRCSPLYRYADIKDLFLYFFNSTYAEVKDVSTQHKKLQQILMGTNDARIGHAR